jgi:hypothetical protein
MTRDEHLAWCKQRALAYVDAGDLGNAVASMASDMNKDDTQAIHPALFTLGIMCARQGDTEGVRRWIEGFR